MSRLMDTLENALLLTAHPDDETMFFLPTFTHVLQKYNLHLLCVTNGNFSIFVTLPFQAMPLDSVPLGKKNY